MGNKRKKTSYNLEYLDDRLKILMFKRENEKHPDLLKQLMECSPESNEFNYWTPLKLIGLSYFIGKYLEIIASMEKEYGSVNIIYIDPFSGCGINEIQKEILAGSPIVTIDCSSKVSRKFDKMYFNDLNKEYTESLYKRLKHLTTIDDYRWIEGKCEIMNQDANKFLDFVTDELGKMSYKNYFAFIDPFFTALSWESFEKLLAIPYGDIMYTLQSKLIAKEIGKDTKDKMFHKQEKIDEYSRFFGAEPEVWLELRTEKKVKEYIIKKIRKHKECVIDIQIKHEGYYYYLIFATRNKNPAWKPIIMNMKKMIEKYSGDAVQYSLDFITGKKKIVTDYWK